VERAPEGCEVVSDIFIDMYIHMYMCMLFDKE